MNSQNPQPLDIAEYKKTILAKKEQQKGIAFITALYNLNAKQVTTLTTFSNMMLDTIISIKYNLAEMTETHIETLNDSLCLDYFADLMIYKAIELNNLELLNFWLEYPNFDRCVDMPETIMPHAFSFGNLEIVNRLLAIPAILNDVKKSPQQSFAPALLSDKPDVLNRYLEIDEALKYVVENSAQALQIANNTGYLEIVKNAIDNYQKPRRKLSNNMA